MEDGHLQRHHYAEAGTGRDGLGRRILRHLVGTCDRCKTEWDRLGPFLQDSFLTLLDRFTSAPPTEVADELLWVDGATLAVHDSRVEQLGRLRRSTFQQLWALRRLPPEKRADAVRNARRRFRGGALAELLIEECRSTVRTNPAEALGWAALVPLVLDWAQGPGAPAWAPLLIARAGAHRANALRVLGDLAAAERTFLDLRRSLGTRPVEDLGVAAELDSLEASLRTAQNRPSDAQELLERAAVAYRYAGDSVGVARVRVKQAAVLWAQGRPDELLKLLDTPDSSVGRGPEARDLHLTLAIVSWRTVALCALDRFEEARFLLERHLDDFEASDEPFTAAVLRGLQGRIALGVGALDVAEEAFVSCRDAHLALGRHHDAALACLDVAEVLLAAGRGDDLRSLASDLVRLFRNLELPTETLRALKLFAQAVRSQRLTTSLLSELRRELTARRPAGFPPSA